MASITASITATVFLVYCGTVNGNPATAVGVSEWYSEPPAHIALGTKSFLTLVKESDMFVDKSLLIKRVLEDEKKYFIVHAPRKFGKSVNLDMLKEFLRIELNSYGVRVIPKAITQNYRLFKDGEFTLANGTVGALKTPLLISLHDDIIETYQGNHPVICFNLSTAYSYDYQSVLLNIASKLKSVYEEHTYLVSSFKKNNMSTIEEVRRRAQMQYDYFDKMLNARGDQADIVNGVNFLAQLLEERFSKKPFLLIDDYDAMFRTMVYNPTYSDKQKDGIFDLFSQFFTTSFLKNPYIEKTVLTGIVPLYTADVFPGNITEYSFETDMFPYYGFFVPETTAMFDLLKTPMHVRLKTYNWYAGYGASSNYNASLCNPWSIVSFINKRTSLSQLKNYWVDTEQLVPILKQITQSETFIEHLLLLVGHEHVSICTNYSDLNRVNAEELGMAIHAQPKEEFLSKYNINLILWYLLKTGYLTGSDLMLDNFLIVRIPNNEIRSEMARIIINYYFIEKHKLDSAIIPQTTKLLTDFVSGQETSPILLKNIHDILTLIPLEKHKIEDAHIKRHVYRDVLQFLFALISIDFTNYKMIIHFHEPHIPCLLLFTQDRGNIVTINYQSIEPSLVSAKKCRYTYFKYDFLKQINVVKFIGVNITTTRNVLFDIESEIIR